MDFKKCTIDNFITAFFEKDYSLISLDETENIYTSYIDVAKLFEGEEFSRISYIHYLSGRINTIKISIKLQKEFLEEFKVPYQPEFKMFKKFGHLLFWKGDGKKFLEILDRIELKELKYISELENEIKMLIEARKNKSKGKSVELTLDGFLTSVISLGKIGYIIDRYKTTMQEMALMVKKQMEDNKS